MLKTISHLALEGLIHRTPWFRGKARLLRLVGRFCEGTMTRSKFGISLEAHLADSTNRFALTGSYDAPICRELACLPCGSAFIDIGANQGLFTVMAAKQVGVEGIVVAFEPQQHMASRLRRNVAANGFANVVILDLALGGWTGVARMAANNTHTGLGHLHNEGNERIFIAEPVLLLPLVQALVGRRAVTVKIDVEGYEAEVLGNFANFFDALNIMTCIVEVDDDHLGRAGSSANALYAIMEGHGFRADYGRGFNSHYDEIFRR